MIVDYLFFETYRNSNLKRRGEYGLLETYWAKGSLVSEKGEKGLRCKDLCTRQWHKIAFGKRDFVHATQSTRAIIILIIIDVNIVFDFITTSHADRRAWNSAT